MDAGTAPTDSMNRMLFSGREGEDVMAFLLHVQQAAFALRRQWEDDWVAAYAGTCLTGPAMWWYTGLDDEDHRSWKRLRRAMLLHFSATDPSVAAFSPSAPPATGTPGRRGYIRVESDDGTVRGYIPKVLDTIPTYTYDTRHALVRAVADALIVEVSGQSDDSSCFLLRMVNAQGNDPQEPYLGMESYSSGRWYLLPGRASEWCEKAGDTGVLSRIWSFEDATEELCVSLNCGDSMKRIKCTCQCSPDGLQRLVIIDQTPWMTPVKLVFLPI